MNVSRRIYFSIFFSNLSYFTILYQLIPLFKCDYTHNEFFYTKLIASTFFTFRYVIPGLMGGNFIDSYFKRFPVLVIGLCCNLTGALLNAISSTVAEFKTEDQCNPEQKWNENYWFIGNFVGVAICSFGSGLITPVFYTSLVENTIAAEMSAKKFYATVNLAVFFSLLMNFLTIYYSVAIVALTSVISSLLAVLILAFTKSEFIDKAPSVYQSHGQEKRNILGLMSYTVFYGILQCLKRCVTCSSCCCYFCCCGTSEKEDKFKQETGEDWHWLWATQNKVETWVIKLTIPSLKFFSIVYSIAFYWACYFQHESIWMVQASQMVIHFPVEYLRIVLPFLVVVLIIPVQFLAGTWKPMTRFCVGLFFGASALFTAAGVQNYIDTVGTTKLPLNYFEMSLGLVNLDHDTVVGQFYGTGIKKLENQTFEFGFTRNSEFATSRNSELSSSEEMMFRHPAEFIYSVSGSNDENSLQVTPENVESGDNRVSYRHVKYENQWQNYTDIVQKSRDGSAKVKFVPTNQEFVYKISSSFGTFSKNSENNSEIVLSANQSSSSSYHSGDIGFFKPGVHSVTYCACFNMDHNDCEECRTTDITVETGAGYVFYIMMQERIFEDVGMKSFLLQTISTNQVSIWYILPQFILLAVSEILIGVSGFEYAYKKGKNYNLEGIYVSIWCSMISLGNFLRYLIFMEPQMSHVRVSAFAWNLCWGVVCIISFLKILFLVFWSKRKN